MCLSQHTVLKRLATTTPTEVSGVPLNVAHETQYELGPSASAGTTHLKDDGVNVQVDATSNKAASTMEMLLAFNAPTTQQSIKTFFEKPTIISQGNLSTANTVPIAVYSALHPLDSLFALPIWTDKLKGNFGLRFTMVFTLQVNASRFQQGRYMLTWCPTGGGTGVAARVSAWVSMHTSTRQARTQLPHVEIDLASQTAVELRIPFSSIMTAFPVSAISDINNYGTLGQLQLWPYEPLVAASGITTAGYTLWCHLEDVTTYAAAVPQSLKVVRSSKGNPSEQEAKAKGVGPISSVLSKVSEASGMLSAVPLLGPYATTLSWSANLMSGVASVFGWSKPINLGVVQRFNRNSVAYATNGDAIDNSMPLSFQTDNAVSVLPGFAGTDVDELSVSAMAMRPAYVTSITWESFTTMPPGYSLAVLEVGPSCVELTSIDNGRSVKHLIPCQFVASQFRQWRGSMQYTFKVVKTEFHSGRIAVCFSPEESRTTSAGATYATSDFLHREIIDIRTCDTFTITVPYTATSPYKNTGTTRDFKIGGLFLYVVDPLIAPSTVSQTIKILVEMSCGPDIEFAIPIPRYRLTPTYNCVPQSKVITNSKPPPNQSEVVNIGNSHVETPNTMFAEACIGEKVVSFRTLLKKHMMISPGPTQVVNLGENQVNVLPFCWQPFNNAIGAVSVLDYPFNDLYSLMCSMFVYSRGGANLKMKTQYVGTYNTGSTIMARMNFIDSGAVINTMTDYDIAALDASTITTNIIGLTDQYHVATVYEEPFIEVSAPQYHQFVNRSSMDHMVSPTTPYRVSGNYPCTQWGITFSWDSTAVNGTYPKVNVTRAAKDDGNFGYFVAVPSMLWSLV